MTRGRRLAALLAGTCVLVYGGPKGLRLHSLEGGETLAEPYLLLSPQAIADWED